MCAGITDLNGSVCWNCKVSINFAKGVIERNVLLIERHLIVNRYVAVDAAVSDNFVLLVS